MQGWVKIHRSIRESLIWQDKPFAKGQAWTDMILMANHEPAKILTKTGSVELERGEFHTEERKLGDLWGWSRSKVRNFLTFLEQEKMITKIVKKSTTGKTTEGTTIKVLNYEVYQCKDGGKKTTGRTSEKPKKDQRKTKEEPKQEPLTSFEEALKEFKEMRIFIKEPLTEFGEKRLLAQLNKMATTEEEKIEILAQSIIRNWRGIFPLKTQQANQQQQTLILDKYDENSEHQQKLRERQRIAEENDRIAREKWGV